MTINFAFDRTICVDENGDMDAPYPNMFSKELYGFDIDLFEQKYGGFPVPKSKMDPFDYSLLNGRSIYYNLNNDLYDIKQNTVDYYIENNLNFIYSILIWNNNLFDKNINLDLPDKVKKQIESGKCKFVIFYVTEPWFMFEHCYTWLSNFSIANNLSSDNFIFVSSNLISPEIKKRYVLDGTIKDNFTIIEFNYFFHRLWFFQMRFHQTNSNEIYDESFNKNLFNLRNTVKEKHFLCFNRRPHDHRIAIFAELMTNEKLKNKSIVTLGKENMIGGSIFKNGIRRFINQDYKHGHERLYNFIDTHDARKDYLYDTDDMEGEHSTIINLDAHYKTFLNIVTETITAEDVLFLSEKIIKPIFALQPFIIIGNRNSLSKLKEFGFKTFDRWWDESYDQEMHQNRFEKIVDLLEDISTWDEDRIRTTLNEMEETLIHNFKMLREDNSTKFFFDKLISTLKN